MSTELITTKRKIDLLNPILLTYNKIQLRPTYHFLLLILGFPVTLVVLLFYFYRRKKDSFTFIEEETKAMLHAAGYKEQMKQEFKDQLLRKQIFFGKSVHMKEIGQQADKWAEEELQKAVITTTYEKLEALGEKRVTFTETFQTLIQSPLFLLLSFIPGLLMYLFIFLYSNFYLKNIFERLFMSIFVIVGVVILVFSILYISPFDPAANLLGESATEEQIASFNKLHGLDQSYLSQLWNAILGIATFNLGSSFTGNEDVVATIANRFPVTFNLTIFALMMAIIIAIPVGIISATRPKSFLDYSLMFVALIGLSIPNFWQGLIFILGFSINLKWLPSSYVPSNWLSMIMPVVVLGTALTASIARMTRSSMLEVASEDYIITAKAKGLSKRYILWKHVFGNAMIPIITVIGLLFGGMLGGAAVTEKVFNISGIGSYIVDKQFVPDIPSILGGVVYIAVTISIVNLIIDLLYAFIDPRIRSKMKQY
ncbi:ABC transporter permease [Metabacillus dongyingensis]|uniref:ABC transporter permease n=1 Tax=Metabacillus dongyingensis TaxID=2874282 RepID=UPI001FB201EA|nr:ABC transporter permease [Metabacillus dongyingensis]UNJ81257.1 Putative glutathione transporter, permease component [Metabacillus dongyingensis]